MGLSIVDLKDSDFFNLPIKVSDYVDFIWILPKFSKIGSFLADFTDLVLHLGSHYMHWLYFTKISVNFS